ncbi:MAG: hypothetical protein AB7O04_03465 [Hyphomonadaceae bacterium]
MILHCPGDEARARRIGAAWDCGRATLCLMGPNRRRIALGARSVLIGLWSAQGQASDEGAQMAGVLAQSERRALLAVWDGRPPIAAAMEAGVPIVVAPDDEASLMSRLKTAAEALVEDRQAGSDLGGGRKRRGGRPANPKRASAWGVAAGVALGLALAIGGLAPFLGRLIGAD